MSVCDRSSGGRSDSAKPALSAVLLALVVAGSHSLGPAPAASQAVDVPDAYLDGLEYRLIGPYRGGRSVAVAGHPTDPLVYYFGSTGGGVWRTDDAGHRWRNVSDRYFRTGSVGAIAVSPSDPEIVYVGMGEACMRGNNSHGDGMYRSADGGATWEHLGLEDTRHIARVVVHPRDPDVVYVAAFGHAWGPNEERGVYRSTDGGASWERLLFVSPDAGAIDLVMDPGDPAVLYAAMWEFRRYPWGLRAAGPGTGLYRSTDAGDSWEEITRAPGLPGGENRGRIGVTVSPADPDRLWVIIEAEDDQTGVYRTDDRGATWSLVSDRAELLQRPWYFAHIHADPRDRNTVYVQNTRLWKSTDGGRTYDRIDTPHGDSHDLWIDPADPTRMIEANDGGGTVSRDGGRSWSSIYNQPTAQFYHVTTDGQFPYRVYGNQQDNSTLSIPSRSEYGAIDETQLYAVGGGEDGYTAVDPRDPNIVYSGDHHWMTRYDHRTKQVSYISPWNEIWWGWGARDITYRFQWVFPILLSPHDPDVLYATSQHVHRSRNGGKSWEIVSPDLSRADPSTLEPTPGWEDDPDTGPYWGPIKRDNTGIEWYATIFAFAESPLREGLLWAGSDDGLIHVSRDGGGSWDDVTPAGLPEFTMISILDPSPHDPAGAYVAGTRYKLDDPRPFLYRTKDYGESWTPITDGIPADDFTRVIRADPVRPGLLYAGTETGLYLSYDDGESWRPFRMNLPVVPIRDLVVKGGDLIVATHGRSFWIFDDLHVIRQVTDEVAASSVHLFRPDTTVRFREGVVRSPLRGESPPGAEGENPPAGLRVHYYLGEAVPGEVTLEFREAGGSAIQTYSSAPTDDAGPRVPTDAGMNRFVWDTRYPGPLEIPGAIYRRYDPTGPLAPPGSYEVVLTVGGRTHVQTVEIVKDPRLETSQAGFDELHEFLLAVRDEITSTHETVLEIRELRAEIRGALEAGRVPGSARAEAEEAIESLYVIEEKLIQFRAEATQDLIDFPVRLNDKLSTLFTLVEMSDEPPARQDYELFRSLRERVDEQRDRFRSLLEATDWSRIGVAVERDGG